jgi:hypothetical protein
MAVTVSPWSIQAVEMQEEDGWLSRDRNQPTPVLLLRKKKQV